MENSHPRILLYLLKKHNIDCRNLIEYINNREYFLDKISDNRKEAKTLILQMINGRFKNKYNDDKDINKFLKDFELEIRNIQNKFYEIDNRFDDITIFNYKGKSLSRILLELENKILQVMIDFFKFKNIQIFTLEYDGLKIIDKPDNKYFSIKQLEYVIFLKTEINMKLEIKEIKDEFPEYKTNANTDNSPKNKIICKNNKVIHHDHCLPENNILGYICNGFPYIVHKKYLIYTHVQTARLAVELFINKNSSHYAGNVWGDTSISNIIIKLLSQPIP